MTLYAFLATLGWLGVAGYVVRQGVLLLSRRAALAEAQEANLVAAHRDRVEADERIAARDAERDERIARIRAESIEREQQQRGQRPVTSKDIKLPDDLDAYVNQWNDEWAREDERGNLRAKYLELHTGDADATWQKVRRAVGVGEMP